MPNRFLRALIGAGGAAGVRVYRRTDGRAGGRGGDGVRVLLLTVAGRNSGAEHTVPLGYFKRGDSYFVVGAGVGSKAEPQWARNLTAAKSARVQAGRRVLETAVERLGSEERDAVWRNLVVARAPSYAGLPKKAGRTFPIFRLRPRSPAG